MRVDDNFSAATPEVVFFAGVSSYIMNGGLQHLASELPDKKIEQGYKCCVRVVVNWSDHATT